MISVSLIGSLAGIVGTEHVLTGDAAAGYAVDWTGRFRGHAAAVVRPRDTAEVAAALALCRDAGTPVVPQGGNTGLVGGGVPLHGEVVLSLARLGDLELVDRDASQVTAGAGVTLQRVADAAPELDLGIQIASRESATVGGAVATNAGGVRVLRYGPMRAQLRGIEAVLSDGTVVSHLAGLTKDNTGYDYPSLLAGSEGTLAVITRARLRLVPRASACSSASPPMPMTAVTASLARRAVAEVPGLMSAEFFTQAGLDVLVACAGLVPPLPSASPAYLLLDAAGPGALDDLAALIGERPAAVGESGADRRRLWYYRERHPEAAGFLGVPIKLDVSVPAAHWVRLASEVAGVVGAADPGARVITFGHVADGNVHVNIVPAAAADGRHEDAVFSFVASLGGSISAEHGIGALKAPWLHLARSSAERSLFARIRGALDPSGTLNPWVLPRLFVASGRRDRAVGERTWGQPLYGFARDGAVEVDLRGHRPGTGDVAPPFGYHDRSRIEHLEPGEEILELVEGDGPDRDPDIVADLHRLRDALRGMVRGQVREHDVTAWRQRVDQGPDDLVRLGGGGDEVQHGKHQQPHGPAEIQPAARPGLGQDTLRVVQVGKDANTSPA